jgi:signal transduction histidine kinase
MPWLYSLLLIAPALLLIETLRGAVHESQMIATQIKQSELQGLRWKALAQAEGLKVLRHSVAHPEGPTASWTEHADVRRYWSEIQRGGPQYLYAAVIDRDGDILLHSDPNHAGRQLQRGWYDYRTTEYGSDLTFSQANPLAGVRPAYDVSIELGDVATEGDRLHMGLDAQWLDQRISSRQRSALAHWAGVLALVGCVELAAGWALVAIARHYNRLQKTVAGHARKRSRELSQIGSGLAHEIRNPLHALRLNLHTLRRAMGGKSSLPPDQIVATINESDSAIDRLDQLMHDLLMFSEPTQGQVAEVDLVNEVRATLRLLSEDFKREQIAVRDALPSEPAQIAIDPTRLRQSLLNLLTFAQHRSGKSGTIEVAVAEDEDGIELSIADSGPALAADQQRKVFEPFQAPSETGSGLGLALVQTYIEEAGGKVSFNGVGTTKSCCRVWFPLAESVKGGTL